MKLTNIQLDLEPNTESNHDLKQETLINEFKEKVVENTRMSIDNYDRYIRPLIRIASGNYSDHSIRYPELKEFKDIKSGKANIPIFD